MGLFSPFFFWPLASSNNTNTGNNSTTNNAKPHTSRHSWTLVNRDQGNGIDTTSPTSTERNSNDPSLSSGNDVGAFDGQVRQPGHGYGHGYGHRGAARDTGLDEEHLISSEQSWKGSRRLSKIKTRFRSRKGQQRQSISELADRFEQHAPRIDGTAVEGQKHDALEEKEEVLPDTIQRESQYADTTEMPQMGQDQPNGRQFEEFEYRKVSERTVQSLDSELTSSTVCHHPSRSPADQNALEDRGYVYEKPFEDLLESSGSKPLTDAIPDDTMHSTRASMSENRDVTPQTCPEQRKHSLEQRRSLPSDELPRKSSIFRNISTLSNESSWSAHIDQHDAVKLFNNVAAQLCMRPVALREGKTKQPDPTTEGKLRRRNGVLGRIRTMRSNVQMRSQPVPPEQEQPRLRRIKTLTSLSSRSDPFGALKGKSLETLARLGGHSFLELPKDFVPALLKLPVCFAATAGYLRMHGHKVQNLFFDPGDFKAATRIYEHFANQVLMAEREGDNIQMTMRSSRMPMDLVDTLQLDAAAQEPSHILSVAWVFKGFLAGIPDGILGSRTLYQVLVDVSYGRPPYITDGPVPQRPDSCLEGLTVWEHVLTKTIALAILALTSKMHLELICGVFGLCHMLLHETQREIEIAWWSSVRKRERRPSWAAGLLDVDRLSRTLGPVLTNRMPEEEEFYSEVPCALKGERVVRMLLEQWRGVSRQLQWWEHCGCPPERIILQPSEEDESEESK